METQDLEKMKELDAHLGSACDEIAAALPLIGELYDEAPEARDALEAIHGTLLRLHGMARFQVDQDREAREQEQLKQEVGF
jgi:hypothetical protein